jgi:hypothetical protein
MSLKAQPQSSIGFIITKSLNQEDLPFGQVLLFFFFFLLVLGKKLRALHARDMLYP